MEQEDGFDHEAQDINSDAFWDRLSSIFKQTHEMISEIAAEQGIDLDALDTAEVEQEENRRRAYSESHPLAQSAEHYIKLVNEWFEREYPDSEQLPDTYPARGDLPLVDFDAQDRATEIQDAVAVIRWYEFQIAVKITRGLIRDEIEEYDDDEEADEYSTGSPRQKDSDGSAKVALIGMERSIGAWARLREFLPAKSDSILPIIIHIEQLRRATEQEFPKAQSFVRPGFDEAPDRFVS